MDFKQLEAFVYVVRLKSFSKAAQRIFLTQPTISAHIGSLERELCTRLLERGTKYVYPTKAGSILFGYAEQMIALREAASSAVKNYTNELKGVLRLAASTVPSQYILPAAIAEFRETYPNITFAIQRQDSEQVVESVAGDLVPLGFCGTDTHRNDCTFDSFATDRLVIITPNNEKFKALQPGSLRADILRREPVVVREEGSGTRKEMESFLRRGGLDLGELNIVAQFDDPDSIKRAVSQGLGISIISNAAVEDYVNFGLLLRFDLSDIAMERQLYMVRHKGVSLPLEAEVFMGFIREFCGR